MATGINAKQLNLVSSLHWTLLKTSSGSFRCSSVNFSCAFMFFLDRKGFLLSAFPNTLYMFSLLLIVLSWTLRFNMLSEACGVWDAPQASLYFSDLGVNVMWRPLLGRLAIVLKAFHLWILALAVGRQIVWTWFYNPFHIYVQRNWFSKTNAWTSIL